MELLSSARVFYVIFSFSECLVELLSSAGVFYVIFSFIECLVELLSSTSVFSVRVSWSFSPAQRSSISSQGLCEFHWIRVLVKMCTSESSWPGYKRRQAFVGGGLLLENTATFNGGGGRIVAPTPIWALPNHHGILCN